MYYFVKEYIVILMLIKLYVFNRRIRRVFEIQIKEWELSGLDKLWGEDVDLMFCGCGLKFGFIL